MVRKVLSFLPIFFINLAVFVFKFHANCFSSLKFRTPSSFLLPIYTTFILIFVLVIFFSFDVWPLNFLFVDLHAKA
jgi:hypothetical protein